MSSFFSAKTSHELPPLPELPELPAEEEETASNTSPVTPGRGRGGRRTFHEGDISRTRTPKKRQLTRVKSHGGIPGIDEPSSDRGTVTREYHAGSLSYEIAKKPDGVDKVLKRRRKGKHEVTLEVLDGVCTSDHGTGAEVDQEYSEGSQSQRLSVTGLEMDAPPVEDTMQYKRRSVSLPSDRANSTPSTLSIFVCDVYYDGILAESMIARDDENGDANETQKQRGLSFSGKKSSLTSKAKSWNSKHFVDAGKTASDLGLRYLEMRVRRMHKRGLTSKMDVVGGFRIQLGGLRQDEPTDRWYIFTEGPLQGKVRVRLTYTSSLPKIAGRHSMRPRLLVALPPLLSQKAPEGEKKDLFWRSAIDDADGDDSGPKTPNPDDEYVEEVFDDICLIGHAPGIEDPYTMIIPGALLLTTDRLLFIPHRPAFRKTSRAEDRPTPMETTKASHRKAQSKNVQIPVGWITEVSVVDALDLGAQLPEGKLLAVTCKVPGIYYFHMGAKTLRNHVYGHGCCAPLRIWSDSRPEEASLEELTYSPEVIADTMVSTLKWIALEQAAKLYGEPLVRDAEDEFLAIVDDVVEMEMASVANPLFSKTDEKVPLSTKNTLAMGTGKSSNEDLDFVLHKKDPQKEEDVLAVSTTDVVETEQKLEAVTDETEDGKEAQGAEAAKHDEEKKPEKIELGGENSEETPSSENKIMFTAEDDYARQNVLARGWRLYRQNSFDVCPSYPPIFVVPKSISDEEVKAVGKYRSKGRLPVLVWRHPVNGAALCRCAQPNAGLAGKKSAEDQKLFLEISKGSSEPLKRSWKKKDSDTTSTSHVLSKLVPHTTSGSPPVPSKKLSSKKEARRSSLPTSSPESTRAASSLTDIASRESSFMSSARPQKDRISALEDEALHIMDLRPFANALANKMMGKGTENLMNYSKGTSFQYGNIPNIHVMRRSLAKLVSLGYSGDWEAGIYESKWLDYTTMLLKLSVETVCKLMGGVSVVVHCSDGWDRTPQVISLSMLLIDPFYRSLRGFLFLIESQWCSFGHMFKKRTNLGGDYSPVFLQFMDCIYQLVHQCPNDFEFTSDLLLFMVEHTYSNYFRTFAANSAREREDRMLSPRCIFNCISANKDSFVNRDYVADSSKRLDVLEVKTSPESIKLWISLYGRPARIASSLGVDSTRKPTFVTRLLHRKTVIEMLPFVTRGIRPPSRTKRTSMFLGAHLSMPKVTRARASIIHQFRRHHGRGSTATLTGGASFMNLNLHSAGEDKKATTGIRSVVSLPQLTTAHDRNDTEEFTNEGGRTNGGGPCTIM